MPTLACPPEGSSGEETHARAHIHTHTHKQTSPALSLNESLNLSLLTKKTQQPSTRQRNANGRRPGDLCNPWKRKKMIIYRLIFFSFLSRSIHPDGKAPLGFGNAFNVPALRQLRIQAMMFTSALPLTFVSPSRLCFLLDLPRFAPRFTCLPHTCISRPNTNFNTRKLPHIHTRQFISKNNRLYLLTLFPPFE